MFSCVTIHECIDVCLCSVCHAHTRSIHVCAFTNAHTLTFSPCVSNSLTRPHARSIALCLLHTLSRARARALFSCVRAHTHMQTLSSLLTDPKTKGLWSNPDSPEGRALLLKTFEDPRSAKQQDADWNVEHKLVGPARAATARKARTTQSMALLASLMVLVVATQVGSTTPPYTHLFVNETAILPG
jgi:hypothetical protein